MIVFSRPNVFNICLFEADFSTYRIGWLSSSRTEKKNQQIWLCQFPQQRIPLFCFSLHFLFLKFISLWKSFLYLIFFFFGRKFKPSQNLAYPVSGISFTLLPFSFSFEASSLWRLSGFQMSLFLPLPPEVWDYVMHHCAWLCWFSLV